MLDPYLIVRAGSLYITVVLTAVFWLWRRPPARVLAGAMLAFAWNLSIVLALQPAAGYFGWWVFDAKGGLLLGMPVDLYLSWAWLWGGGAALAFPSLTLWAVTIVGLAFDVALMPALSPVLRLGPWWYAGEALGLVLGLVPGQLLARWTARRQHLAGRALLQVLTFTGLVLVVVPVIAIEASGSVWRNPLAYPAWQLSLIVQALAVPALFGLTAVQEFVERGGGTPVPFDPPDRLVSSGIYAYIRNPMQLSGVTMLVLMGILVWNPWVSVAGLLAHIYSVGIAGWDEDEDLERRFGPEWATYRQAVRGWVPRVRPWRRPGAPPARLYVSQACDMCSEVGRWFEERGALGLSIVAAELHTGGLTRITYDPGDGSGEVRGVEAVGRALEHVHLGWALAGWALRLPVVRPLVQLLVDASGGEARAAPPLYRGDIGRPWP